MLQNMDSAEIAYQIAYDLVENEEQATRTGRGTPAGPAWVDLTDPDAYAKLKQRMGMR